MEIFDELARICSEENNASVQRELLIREGTAKFADTVGENDRHLQKIIQKQVSFPSAVPVYKFHKITFRFPHRARKLLMALYLT